MDILFASSKGSQYRYFKTLIGKLPYRCGLTTLYPCFPRVRDIKHIDIGVLKKGTSFHISRKKTKLDMHWLPDSAWYLYTVKAYIRFILIFLSFCAFFRKNDVKYVGLWNGHRLPEMAIRLAAKISKVKTIFFENGLLPNTTTMDFFGVNDKSSLVRNADFYKHYALSLPRVGIISSQIEPRRPHKKKIQEKLVSRPQGAKYLFAPFQVDFDSQILINSNWIHSMDQFYSVLESVIDQIEDKEIIIVVKEHPSDPKSFKRLHGNNSRIHFSNESTEELIAESEAVITINSSVGLESLTLNKKVIVLGEACFKIPRITLSAMNIKDLVCAINRLNAWNFDEDVLRGFIGYLSKEYLLRGGWQRQVDKISQEHVFSLIRKLSAEVEGDERFISDTGLAFQLS